MCVTWICHHTTTPCPDFTRFYARFACDHYFTVESLYFKTENEGAKKFNSSCFGAVTSFLTLYLAGQAPDNSFLVFVSTLTVRATLAQPPSKSSLNAVCQNPLCITELINLYTVRRVYQQRNTAEDTFLPLPEMT